MKNAFLKIAILCGSVFTAAPAFADSWINNVQITAVQVMKDGRIYVRSPQLSACGGHAYASLTDGAGKEMYSTLLAAKVSRQKVAMSVGGCAGYFPLTGVVISDSGA